MLIYELIVENQAMSKAKVCRGRVFCIATPCFKTWRCCYHLKTPVWEKKFTLAIRTQVHSWLDERMPHSHRPQSQGQKSGWHFSMLVGSSVGQQRWFFHQTEHSVWATIFDCLKILVPSHFIEIRVHRLGSMTFQRKTTPLQGCCLKLFCLRVK